MRSNSRPFRVTLQHKLILAHVVVTLVAVLVVEVIVLRAVDWIAARPIGSLHFALVIICAALAGLLLGAWASRPIARRVGRALEISQAWATRQSLPAHRRSRQR